MLKDQNLKLTNRETDGKVSFEQRTGNKVFKNGIVLLTVKSSFKDRALLTLENQKELYRWLGAKLNND